MATASIPIKKLPPGPERPELHYAGDGHLHLPVSATFHGGDDWTSTGIGFDDYHRMSTQQRKQSGERRLPTPPWALNDSLLRSVLVKYCEERTQMYGPQPGTEQERLQRALQRIEGTRPRREETLSGLCRQFVALKNDPDTDPARLKKLAQEIEGHDTVLRVDQNLPQLVTGVVYFYCRVGLDSVGTASELGIKPPHVRQILWRLRRCWKRITGELPPTRLTRPRKAVIKAVIKPWRPHITINVLGTRPANTRLNVELAGRLFAEGKTYAEIAKAVGHSKNAIVYAFRRAGLFQPRQRIGPRKQPVTSTRESNRAQRPNISTVPEPQPSVVSAPTQTPYEKYKLFCETVGAKPMHELMWAGMHGGTQRAH